MLTLTDRLKGWAAEHSYDRLMLSTGCYLQGVNEATHGIADSLLSVAAVRAQDIVTDILRRRGDRLGSGSCG